MIVIAISGTTVLHAEEHALSEFDDILAFVRVVELGSLTRAAEQLGLSKSMVSRRLDRLEGALDVKLLQRSTRGIKPTEAGRKFEGRCIHILAELEHARAEVAGQDGRLSGRLRLAVPMSFGWRHLGSALAAFSVEHDHLMLDVAYDDRAVDLVGEGFDAAVRIGTLLDSRLVARRLAPIRIVTVASPLYLKASSEPKTPAALAHHPCLRASMNPYGDTWRFRIGPRWVSVLPGDARYRADNGEALLEGAIAPWRRPIADVHCLRGDPGGEADADSEQLCDARTIPFPAAPARVGIRQDTGSHRLPCRTLRARALLGFELSEEPARTLTTRVSVDAVGAMRHRPQEYAVECIIRHIETAFSVWNKIIGEWRT